MVQLMLEIVNFTPLAVSEQSKSTSSNIIGKMCLWSPSAVYNSFTQYEDERYLLVMTGKMAEQLYSPLPMELCQSLPE